MPELLEDLSMEYLVIALSFVTVKAAQIDISPTSATVSSGSEVTMNCSISGLTQSDFSPWKKESGISLSILVNNQTPLNPDKYELVAPYNLVIKQTDNGDNAIYMCVIPGGSASATLTIVDLPQTFSLLATSTISLGSTVTISCKTTHGRPPPELRLSINATDVTHNATYTTSTMDSEGFADAILDYPIVVTSDLLGISVVCLLDYQGWDSADSRSYIVALPQSSASRPDALWVVFLTGLLSQWA